MADSIATQIALGKTESVTAIVDDSNTAISMRSGSLPVFATPSMIALMEQAACACLLDCVDEGQTSVGIGISVEHTAASPIDARISATATIESVFGRKIVFTVTASDDTGEIGNGKHTRIIVDTERFMKKIRPSL